MHRPTYPGRKRAASLSQGLIDSLLDFTEICSDLVNLLASLSEILYGVSFTNCILKAQQKDGHSVALG